MTDLHTLLTGLMIGESARWHDGRLWLSNWGSQEVLAVDADGKSEVMARVATTLPFSIDWLPDGRLLIVSGQEALLLRQEPDGSLVTHADLSGLARIWNEIVVDGRGNIYLNGMDYDFMGGGPFIPGVIALVTPDGAVRRVAGDIRFPNGMVVTPDNRTLIIAESFAGELTAFDIGADGGLSNRRVWADLGEGVPDSISADAENAIWYADVPTKRCVRVREGGQQLQMISLDRGCFACALGGRDGTTLFMLAQQWNDPQNMFTGPRSGLVLTAQAPAPRAGWP